MEEPGRGVSHFPTWVYITWKIFRASIATSRSSLSYVLQVFRAVLIYHGIKAGLLFGVALLRHWGRRIGSFDVMGALRTNVEGGGRIGGWRSRGGEILCCAVYVPGRVRWA